MSQQNASKTMRDENEGIEERISEAVNKCLEDCESEGNAAAVLADELDEQARRVRREELGNTRYELGQYGLTRAAGEFELSLRSYHRVYGKDSQEQTLSEVLHRIEALISEVQRAEEDILPALESIEEEELQSESDD